MKLTKENFGEKYPECLVEYRPIMVNGFSQGIEVIGDRNIPRVLGEIERGVDIQRARKAGCKTDEAVCKYLNGVKE